jgi:ParB-like chromosome segregation protein Spo0J
MTRLVRVEEGGEQSKPQGIPVQQIVILPEIASLRTPLDEDHLERLVLGLERQGDLTPIHVAGKEKICIDGHYRLEAYRRAGRPTIPAIVHETMSRTDCLIYFMEANRANGLPYSKQERIGAARQLLAQGDSVESVAEDCELREDLVQRLKDEMGEQS